MTAAAHLERVRGWLTAYYRRAGTTEVPVPPDWPDTEDLGACLAIDVEQGEMPWYWLRCGLFTSSNANRVMTPKRRNYSSAASGLIARLLGEELLGEPYDWGASQWTERGTGLEHRARKWYEAEFGVEVREVGFLLAHDGTEGGSPDGLVGDDGLIEIKCRSAENHMEAVLGLVDFPKAPGQVQHLLKISGRAWCDMVAFNPSPRLPNRVERIWRDEVYIGQLDACLAKAKQEMAEARTVLEGIGTARINRMSRAEWALRMLDEYGADEEEEPMEQDELAAALVVLERAVKAGAVSEERKASVREAAMQGDTRLLRAVVEAVA